MSAQQFVKQYFAGASYSRVEKEKDDGFWEYEVWLSDGSQVEFDEKGEWKSVDCKYSVLPIGIIPFVIAEDIAKKYPDLKPYKIEKRLADMKLIFLATISITAMMVCSYVLKLTNNRRGCVMDL